MRYFLQDSFSANPWLTSNLSSIQVVLGKAARNDDFFGGFLNICLGYGFALMIGICIRWDKQKFCIAFTRLRPYLDFNDTIFQISCVVSSFLSSTSDCISDAFNDNVLKSQGPKGPYTSSSLYYVVCFWATLTMPYLIHLFYLNELFHLFLTSGGVSGGHRLFLFLYFIKKILFSHQRWCIWRPPQPCRHRRHGGHQEAQANPDTSTNLIFQHQNQFF